MMRRQWIALLFAAAPCAVPAQVTGLSQDAAEDYRLPPLEAPRDPSQLSGTLKLLAREIRVEGVTAFEPEQIAAIVRPYVNRMLTSAELQALRVELTRLYVDNGYVTSGVLLPDQEVIDGVVTYRAVEGLLSDVELVGDSKLSRRYVAKRVARHVTSPLNVAEVQYALRHLQRDPNVLRLDARLAPSSELGRSVLRLSIDDQPRFQLGIVADNHRATSTGAERTALTFGWRNLTGHGEEFRASIGLTEGAEDHSASFSLPFTARNASVQAYYSNSDADIIEDRFAELDIKSQTETHGLALSVSLIDRIEGRLAVSLGFESTHSETELLGVPFSFSPGAVEGVAETAAGLFSIDWLKRADRSAAGVRLSYRRGLDALDATVHDPTLPDPFNPTGADALFDLWQGQVTYIRRLGSRREGVSSGRAQLLFRTIMQISGDPLLSLEKIAIGGVQTVRGYPENLLVRDNGVAATLELQLPLPGFRANEAHPANLVFAPFIDYGRSWDEVDTDPGSDVRNTDEARSIWSAGLGLLWSPVKGLEAQVYYGADVGDTFEGDDPRQYREPDLQDDGVHFGLTYVFRW